MNNYLNLRAALQMFLVVLALLVACTAEEDDPEAEECDYSTYNPNSADYSCQSGFVAVGDVKCCPSNAPYHCPSKGKCYTSCEAANDAGCGNVVLSTTSGGSGGGGGGGGGCSTSYNGPTGDIQSDAFCQAAWNYRCYGQDAQAEANCTVYRQMQDDNPGMPDCPYCD